EMQEYILSFGN
ncbi:hypothetical protein C1I82_03095, partial [Helicobacter pylori]